MNKVEIIEMFLEDFFLSEGSYKREIPSGHAGQKIGIFLKQTFFFWNLKSHFFSGRLISVIVHSNSVFGKTEN
jgi:hypothetical protein